MWPAFENTSLMSGAMSVTVPYGMVIVCRMICFTSRSAYIGALPCADATLIASSWIRFIIGSVGSVQ